HWTHFYTDYGVDLQKRFFAFFLKGEDNGWDRQPAVQLQVRHIPERYVERHESEWPIARTIWTHHYLDPSSSALVDRPPADEQASEYDPLGPGLTFQTPP